MTRFCEALCTVCPLRKDKPDGVDIEASRQFLKYLTDWYNPDQLHQMEPAALEETISDELSVAFNRVISPEECQFFAQAALTLVHCTKQVPSTIEDPIDQVNAYQ